MSKPINASIGELLRSAQRDEQYLHQMSNNLNAITQKWFGLRNWIQLRQELELFNKFLYYLVTTLSGLQTLGEEYVRIVQIDGNKLMVPKLLKRVLMIGLQTFTPLILTRSVSAFNRIIQNRQIQLPSVVNSDRRRHQLTQILPYIEQFFQIIYRIHLILFYLFGNYYHLSKRVTNVRYTLMRGSLTDNRSSNIYKILGLLTLSQLCLSLLIRYYSFSNSSLNTSNTFRSDTTETNQKSLDVSLSQRCSLCLQTRQHTTATPCGHLFCWYCITEWLQVKNECPLCREPVQTSRIVFLNNFP